MMKTTDKSNWPKDKSLSVRIGTYGIEVVKNHHMTTVVHTENIALLTKDEAIQLALLLIKAGQQ